MSKLPPKNYSRSVDVPTEITMRPIGVIHSPHRERFGTPRQACVVDEPNQRTECGARLEIYDDRLSAHALRDLEGFDRIWIVAYFHLNQGFNSLVTPPRGPRVKRGLLSTRSPHRPNGIGLSCCRLLGIEGMFLELGAVDFLDGTPVLDVKPYIPFADAFSDSKAGWVDEII